MTGLKTELSSWLNRSDQTARYDTFIALAESEIRRVLRTKHATVATFDTVAADGEYTIANWDEFCELKEVYITAPVDSAGPLDPVTAGLLHNNRRLTRAANSRPRLFTIQDSTITLSPIPDDAYTIAIEFEGLLTPLSDSNASNYVLLAYPDVYLYGCLMHAAPYLDDDARIGTWKGFFDQAIEQLEKDQIRNEYPQRLSQKPPVNFAPIHQKVRR